ncbi:hypothetical protein ACL02U_08575 [Streptomyces sp. MS06]|uniref:hypothetical protein n=1 Tax=Streptomyces sp. MS06 TaxID=3385974 RepID=UPI0039A218AC
MSEIAEQHELRSAAMAVVHESYSFACMRCGHGWEQSYKIEHHTDAEGHEYVRYVADGEFVPSPLQRPACRNCDSQVIRIMRPGRVSSAHSAAHSHRDAPPAGPAEAPAPEGELPGQDGDRHHWHLSDLLHPFHRKAG